MILTKEQIEKINKKCPYEQGIFTEPWGIPCKIKEPVIYTRYTTGGYQGGSCWGDEATYHTEQEPANKFKVLDIILEELMPNITYLQYRKIEQLIHTNEETHYEYYGNSTDSKVEYIKLSEFLKLLESFE